MGWGSKLKKFASKATSVAGSEIERASQGLHHEYKRWGRDTLKSVGYGALEQLRVGVRYGAREMGYNDKESESLGDGLGANYQQVETAKTMRKAEESDQVALQALERRRIAEEARAKGQIAVRVRRGMRDGGPSTRSGTQVTGPAGLGSSGFGSFAAMLGL